MHWARRSRQKRPVCRVDSVERRSDRDVKGACCLSAEFLIGPQLGNKLLALGIEDNARRAPIDSFGIGTSLTISSGAPRLGAVYKLKVLNESQTTPYPVWGRPSQRGRA
jgi:hypothetical protein